MARKIGGHSGPGSRDFTNIYLVLVVLASLVLVQATLLTRVRLWGTAPNLLLVAVIAWSLARSIEEGLLWGFIGGLGVDLVAGMPLGTSSLALMASSFLAGIGQTTVFPGNLTLPVFVVGLATLAHGWIMLLIAAGRGLPVNWVTNTVQIIGPEILLNAALAIVVYPALSVLGRAVGRDRMGL
jgi:rod shape-determining protein MreD